MTRANHRSVATAVAALALAALVLAVSAAAQSWDSAGSLVLARLGHRATLLVDGRVLVTGGSTAVGNTYDTKAVEIYDPGTNTWSATGSTANGRDQGHVAARLPGGKVIVAGGVNANVCTFDNTAELYDPATGTWSFTGSLAAARYFPTATPLADGRVLVAGGGNRCGTAFSSAEIYDPATGTWSATGSMTIPREFHSAVGLLDGRVLVVGGATPGPCCPFPSVSSAEIYDPALGTWSATGSMATDRVLTTLTRLADGRVMATGGYSTGPGFSSVTGPSVEIFDPSTGLWSPTGSLSVARSSGTLSLLANGMVLAVGGTDGATTHSSAELWDPATDLWSGTASLTDARNSHSATVLSNGKVLVAAGYDGTGCCLSSAELYSPVLTVSIDVMPESDDNAIKLSRRGVIPVAVLGTSTFDASTVDPSTVCFGDAEVAAQRDCTVAPGTILEDVNEDGFLDLVLHFNTQQTGVDPGDAQACLTGELSDGTSIEGCDSITTR